MAVNNGLSTITGSRSEESTSFSELGKFLKAKLDAQSDEISFEEKLNSIRQTNVEHLGSLSRKNREEALREELAQVDIVLKKEQRAREAEADKDYEEKLKALKSLGDAEAKAKKVVLDKEYKDKRKQIENEIKWRADQEQKLLIKKQKEQRKQALKESNEYAAKTFQEIFSKGASWEERKAALGNMWQTYSTDKDGNKGDHNSNFMKNLGGFLINASHGIADFARGLESTIDDIAKKKGTIDTRLQGSKSATVHGSYWGQISKDITGAAGVSPLIKQSDVVSNVERMVNQGIAFNVTQRATIETMKDKIAGTFESTNATLLRLVRIQNQDTTAGRLGMESALTSFLNNMYETTEYMQNIASQVKGSLEEAMSLMTGESAVSFEYQVQKWLGSMYSTGMSDSAVNGLAQQLGQLAAGNLEGITNGGKGNLIVMAANRAGLNISDLLNDGLNADTTNKLLASINDYMASLYEEAGDSKVLQQQFASVFGMTASDLKAAVNLSKSSGVVSSNGLTYASAIKQLNRMASTMAERTSMAELMGNMFDNIQYSMAAGVGSNPALYATYKAANFMKANIGDGINFGIPMVMGNGMPITFNVADLMTTGALGMGMLNSIGSIIGAGGGGGITGSGILKAVGVGNGIATVARGNGEGLIGRGGASVSSSGGLIGGSGDDVQGKTMTDATDSANSQTANAVDETENVTISDVDTHIIQIYELIQEITDGRATLNVNVQNTQDFSDISRGI